MGAFDKTTEDVVEKPIPLAGTLGSKPKNPGGKSQSKGDFDKGCSDICTKRETSRKEKFGGDLLNFQDVLKLAESAHEKVISKLRQDYGEYFERMFVDGTNKDGGTRYFGMRPADLEGPSRDRMKRKMKIKVLKMMASIEAASERQALSMMIRISPKVTLFRISTRSMSLPMEGTRTPQHMEICTANLILPFLAETFVPYAKPLELK